MPHIKAAATESETPPALMDNAIRETVEDFSEAVARKALLRRATYEVLYEDLKDDIRRMLGKQRSALLG